MKTGPSGRRDKANRAGGKAGDFASSVSPSNELGAEQEQSEIDGMEDTFVEDIDDLERATAELRPLAEKVSRYSEAQGISGKTVTVKIKYSDFTQAMRSRTGTVASANMADVFDAASGLLATVYPFKRSVRLLGVMLSSLTSDQPSDATEGQPQLDLNL